LVNKTEHLLKFKKLYEQKNQTTISDELALEYFENLILLVSRVTEGADLSKLIIK
jgi:hypothetical protein